MATFYRVLSLIISLAIVVGLVVGLFFIVRGVAIRATSPEYNRGACTQVDTYNIYEHKVSFLWVEFGDLKEVSRTKCVKWENWPVS